MTEIRTTISKILCSLGWHNYKYNINCSLPDHHGVIREMVETEVCCCCGDIKECITWEWVADESDFWNSSYGWMVDHGR